MQGDFHLLGPTESYFRRTGVLVASIIFDLTYIISVSIFLGMLVEKLGLFDMTCIWGATYIFFATIVLSFDIGALYQKNDPERGSSMILGNLLLCFLLIWSIPSFKDLSSSVLIMYSVSIGFFALKCCYAVLNIILLTNCNRGIPEHNISLRRSCRRGG
ncbi:MAG: hypothetical protein Hyperionvirus13_21 [Hyperionvirus sp.]|uniref:Uncharacterized protein n=1 Tax=Hyperionvirus sp. TaxID=2487770 RepID=A0A3G5A9E0_9VIRU|nr:MAG: hypothetical protein Hyperionvirus13_21 [Hyperionvirus sp.]